MRCCGDSRCTAEDDAAAAAACRSCGGRYCLGES